jgi:uncharacterized protein involved in exopolysaccharide biosynthesis
MIPSDPHSLSREDKGPLQLHHPQVVSMPLRRRATDRMERRVAGASTLGAWLAMLERQKWLMLMVFVVGLGVLGIYVALMPKKYEGELKVMVRKERAENLVSAAPGSPALPPTQIGEAELSAEIELFRGRDQIEKMLTELRPERMKQQEQKLREIASLEKNLKVLPVGKTTIISARLVADAPDFVSKALNRLAELYQQRHVELHSNGRASAFFGEQAKQQRERVDQARAALLQFRTGASVSLIQEQKQNSLRRASDLEGSLQSLDAEIRDNENRLLAINSQIRQQAPLVETSTRLAKNTMLIERLRQLQLELTNKRTELLTKYDPSYRLVKEVDRQLADTKAALEREQAPGVVDQTRAPNPLRSSLEAETLRLEAAVAGLRARRENFARDLSQSKGRLGGLERSTGEHDRLEQELRLAEESFLLYQRKYEEARLSAELDQQGILDIRLLEKAQTPLAPMRRHRSFVLIFGTLGCMLMAFAAGFTRDYLSRALPNAIAASRLEADLADVMGNPAALPSFHQRRQPSALLRSAQR